MHVMQEPIDACYAIMIFEVHGWSFKSFSLIKFIGAKLSVYRMPLIDRACKENVNVK